MSGGRIDAADKARADARAAGLRYSTDEEPGITRVRRGKGFSYYGPDQSLITGHLRDRCQSLGIPPAYEGVWICTDERGHLQATGRDARARKTYRYHEGWRSFRDERKFEQLLDFGDRLGRARRHNDAMRAKRGFKKERLLGAVFHLLDTHALRIGNETYAAENDSYGATTLRQEHFDHGHVRFTAKSGRAVDVTLHDKRFTGLAKRLTDLPGQHLFQYEGEDGDLHPLSSSDVNAYLEEAFGTGVTAKAFRTWAGSVAAFDRGAKGEQSIGDVVEAAAKRLRNTQAVARKAYIHPAIIDAVREDRLAAEVSALRPKVSTRKTMTRAETLFLRWLSERT